MKIAQLPVLDSYQTKSTVIGDVKARTLNIIQCLCVRVRLLPKKWSDQTHTVVRQCAIVDGSPKSVSYTSLPSHPAINFDRRLKGSFASETTYPSSLRKKNTFCRKAIKYFDTTYWAQLTLESDSFSVSSFTGLPLSPSSTDSAGRPLTEFFM